MDSYRMNRGGCRSVSQNGCQRQPQRQNIFRQSQNCMNPAQRGEMYRHLDDHLPRAMGYVPFQKWGETFELCKALQMGTIFPALCRPFCGKGGGVCR